MEVSVPGLAGTVLSSSLFGWEKWCLPIGGPCGRLKTETRCDERVEVAPD